MAGSVLFFGTALWIVAVIGLLTPGIDWVDIFCVNRAAETRRRRNGQYGKIRMRLFYLAERNLCYHVTQLELVWVS